MNARDRIQKTLDDHSLKAQHSAYDRDTCVHAILTVRESLLTIPADIDAREYEQHVLNIMDELFNNHHDPEGEFTSGRGVIGSLRDDIRLIFNEQIR